MMKAFLENSVFIFSSIGKRRFQIFPLCEAFLKNSVFGDRIRLVRVDGKAISKEKFVFKQKLIRVDGA